MTYDIIGISNKGNLYESTWTCQKCNIGKQNKLLVDTIRGQSYNFKNTLFVDTVYVVAVKTWSGMKYAKSFPLENDEGEGGWSHKSYREKKNKQTQKFQFLMSIF